MVTTQKFCLAQIETQDKLLHQGIYFKPKKNSKCAILWVHGFMSTFYRNVQLLEILAQSCEKYGYGFATFNNRGHDIITGIKRRKKSGHGYLTQGAACEKFDDCIYDIEAGVKFLLKQKFSKIILVGHSTGANKICCYAANKPNPKVTGIVLASPVSDRLTPSCNAKKLQKTLRIMHRLVKQGKEDQLVTGHLFFPITPKRFISLYQPRTKEDTFDYGDSKPQMKYYAKIKLPMFTIFGAHDEFLDRPVNQVVEVFDNYAQSTSYASAVIPKASHGFNKNEKKFVDLLLEWIAELQKQS